MRLIAFWILVLVPAVAQAGGAWHIPHPHLDRTPDPGKPRAIPYTHERAGWPLALSKHARPTRSRNVTGLWVGGGAVAGHGEPRYRHEGTWGTDDTGMPWHHHRVHLGWWHGRKAQGGRGAYATDGYAPRDVIAHTSRFFQDFHRGSEKHD